MFKKMTVVLIAFLLLGGLLLPVSAQEHSFVVDNAGLMIPEEITILEEKAEEIRNVYGIDSVILTIDTLNGDRAQDYADAYYDNAGFGENGVLFLLAMEEREWYISTSGTLIYALTDYGIQQVGEGVVPFFADALWYDGFHHFLDSLPVYLDAFQNGVPIDGHADYTGDYYHADQEEVLYYEEEFTPSFFFSLLCGIVISGVVVLIMRLSMNTKRAQQCAGEYMVEGSWKLTQRRDIFLYSNVTKTRKQEPPQNTGGGSSVHRSSSERRHGGGGGKF